VISVYQIAEKLSGRLFKKSQRRGARKIEERRRTCQSVGARRLNATKHMGLFQQPADSERNSNYGEGRKNRET
jgi:hypothetical protein